MLGSWMTTYLGKSCSFGLPRVPFVNCRQFMYLVISLLDLRAGCGIWLYQFLIIAYRFTSKYGPSSTFLWMCSLLLKERTFVLLFALTAAVVVQCGGRKTYAHSSTIVQFIFHLWSFEISEHILRYQNLIIGLNSYSSQRFIYLDPIVI